MNIIEENSLKEDLELKNNDKEHISGFIITNLFKDDDVTEYRSIRDLHKNPPVLTLIENEENSMSLNLDLETVKILLEDLKVIEKGFYGYKYDKLSLKEKIKNLPKDIKYLPIPYIWFGLILFLILILSLFFT